MYRRLLRALSIVASVLTVYFLIAIIVAPLDESYAERIPYLLVLCFAGSVVVFSNEWSWRAASKNRRALGTAAAGLGPIGIAAALAFHIFMGWTGLLSALALLGLVAVAGTVIAIGTWAIKYAVGATKEYREQLDT